MRGGKKYGEGVFGMTFDACQSIDTDTFCKLPELRKATRITLYGGITKKEKVLERKIDVENFRTHLAGLDEYVVKVFKAQSDIEKSFREELASIRQVCQVFTKDQLKKYTTLASDALTFQRMAYIGISTDNGIFATFARRCQGDLMSNAMGEVTDATAKKLVDDIKPALEVMARHRFAHSDLKPDNIIYCATSKRFKLIDWGLARPLTTPANLYTPNEFCCPLGHYISGTPWMLAMGQFYMANFKTFNTWCMSPIFMEVFLYASEHLSTIVASTPSTEDLFRKYAHRFDMFNLGLVVAYFVWRHNLDWRRYRNVCFNLLTI
jgi:serine/threonine protein kinase